MKIDFEEIFPEGMTDESAWAINKALYHIADSFEVRFMGQIVRENRELNRYEMDPDRPWERLK